MKYRAEIDGLRAVAVVPVILFHAGFEFFSGGFVGVDIFFVISGYLITSILIEDLENKKFSIVKFYERRARRILPALYVVMLACIPFAWMWMLPSQMKDFSQSLVAVSLFVSNILFWRESGYFDAVAEEKPLLHTWSLAVEEQYYVLFPILLIIAWRSGKDRVFWLIVVLAAISLMLSDWGWRNQPSANFYLSFSRAWELFAGSIAAFIVQKNGVQKNNILSLIGLAAIIFSILIYDETTPFPSLYTLVPVGGAVLLVLYANKETLVAKILSSNPLVGIGLISYSAYLWHQPLLAFARIRLLEPPTYLMALLAFCAFLLAAISWKFVEMPFRKNGVVSGKIVALVSCAMFVFFIAIGVMGHTSRGFQNRAAAAHLPKDFYNFAYIENTVNASECINSSSYVCKLLVNDSKDYKMLLVGDSHSVDFQKQFINEATRKMFSADQFSITGCGFVWDELPSCKTKIEALKKIAIENKYDEIIFVTALYAYENKGITPANWNSYEKLFDVLAENTKSIYIFTPRYFIKSSHPIQNILFQNESKNAVSYFGVEEKVNDFYSYLEQRHDNLHIYNQADVLISLSGEGNFTAMSKDGYPLYRDSNHITRFSAKYIYDDFIHFKEITSSKP